jgi:hypothetical protein
MKTKINDVGQPWHGAEVEWKSGKPPINSWYLTRIVLDSPFRGGIRAFSGKSWSFRVKFVEDSISAEKAANESKDYWQLNRIMWCEWWPENPRANRDGTKPKRLKNG